MSKENIDMLEDTIRHNIIEDHSLWDLFNLDNATEDNEFELMMHIISESIEEWTDRLANRSSEG
tara:strand:+ start:188 stop:379 length:192 start_codon:yes stop_codon:yes gene_type:complete